MSPGPRPSWWTVPAPNPRAAVTLLCLAYAGGSPSMFRSWPGGLPGDIEIWAVHLPGRTSRLSEPLLTRVTDLIDQVGEALLPEVDRPFACFGHSLGGLLAFELARWFRRRHHLPAHLFVSGRRAPQAPSDDPPVYTKNDQDLLAYVDDLNRLPAEVRENEELLAIVLRTLRADFELGDTYHYVDEPPLACPITAFGGSTDCETLQGRLGTWRAQTTARFEEHVLEGGHFFLESNRQELLKLVAAHLRGDVAAAAPRLQK
jgi:medium-chain acyl-[acyl-carrier-protein] hydrolase